MINDRNTACRGRFLAGLLIIWLSFFFLGSPSVNADERIVTVGVYENAPKIFTDKSGQPSGIFIDIIEYEPAVRTLTNRILESVGYRVMMPVNAEDAIEQARQYTEPIHIVLSDVIMPGMNGPEVFLKLAEHHPEARVLCGECNNQPRCFKRRPFFPAEAVYAPGPFGKSGGSSGISRSRAWPNKWPRLHTSIFKQ